MEVADVLDASQLNNLADMLEAAAKELRKAAAPAESAGVTHYIKLRSDKTPWYFLSHRHTYHQKCFKGGLFVSGRRFSAIRFTYADALNEIARLEKAYPFLWLKAVPMQGR
jgi:hypothetical protein